MNAFFASYLTLIDHFLDRRPEIADRIERDLLNVRDKETMRRRDRPFFERTFDACFFGLPQVPPELARLKGQLGARHLADGFEPVASERTHVNELDALELVIRAYEHWERDRWPGRSGRLGYAQTLYSVFMLRQLEGLSLRIWDEDVDRATDRLAALQRRLDRLNGPDSPVVLLRDAAWLIQTAQGPLTKHLQPYFAVAERIAESLSGTRRLDVHKAGARLAGGHLRSQLRYRLWQTGRPPSDPENLGFTRNSNALDSALLVGDLVPLLESYRAARIDRDEDARLDLADAILQGVSADPELYVTRLDLLGPYVMVEHLFVEHADNRLRLTAMGEMQQRSLTRYEVLIGELAPSLIEDAAAFDPEGRPYSPQGIAYGFIADMMSNIAQNALRHPSFGLSLEDMFVSRGSLEDKLARATEWQGLPRRHGESQHFECSTASAVESHMRLTAALTARALHPARLNASERRNARIFVGTRTAEVVAVNDYCVTSDTSRAQPHGPVFCHEQQLVTDRNEGRFLASVPVAGGWFGISKAILTAFTCPGSDVAIDDVPEAAIDVLQLTCPTIVAAPESDVMPPD